MAWWHRRYSAPEVDEKIKTIQTTNITIKGNEPFRSFNEARVILNISGGNRSHNFEFPSTDFVRPWSVLKAGDTLRIQFSKVTAVKFPWYKRLLLKLVEAL